MSGTYAEPERGSGGRLLGAFRDFLVSARFPLVVLSLLGALELLLVVVLLVPPADAGFGAFAEEFQAWCFGARDASGHPRTVAIVLGLSNPLGLGAIVAFFWREPLRELFRREKLAWLRYLAGAVLVIAFVTLAAARDFRTEPPSDLPFPAEALRTSLPLPEFSLENQQGTLISAAELRGHVVVLTGIYAGCYHTCPLIMAQLDRALAALSPAARGEVRVVAVTLAPEADTREVRAGLAERHGVSAPRYEFLGGEPDAVNRTLDALQIARQRNPETGMIDHANLFVVLDRTGKVAYRFTLGPLQEKWLERALSLLTAEARAGGA
jgi:cytochrome oxidase Cu insertion factor (SCO1/SenC/PrrC family)